MRNKNVKKQTQLKRRHRRVRKSVKGTADKPRLCVRRSLGHMTAVIVDDLAGKTIAQVRSAASTLRDKPGDGSLKMRRSVAVGEEIAKKGLEAGVKRVCFDRGGRLYHGRIKALADAARKGGLEF